MKFFISFIGIFLSSIVFAFPAQVILVRHGEKPADGNELSEQGCYRSFLISNFFWTHPIASAFGQPEAYFAMAPNSSDGSIRAVQTLLPTAVAQGKVVNDPFVRDQTQEMAQQILADSSLEGKTVVVAWEHKHIVNLAAALGLPSDPNVGDWPGKVFDQAWIINWVDGVARLQIVPEKVLPSDNPFGGIDHWQDGPLKAQDNLSNLSAKCQNNDELHKMASGSVNPSLP
jgi:hypothetical protein